MASGKEAYFAIEIDDDRVERISIHGLASALGDAFAPNCSDRKVRVLEILTQLALAELGSAAGLSNIRQVRINRQLITERLSDEDLARRIGQVLDGANDMRDLEVLIIHHASQVIQACTVRTLHDVIRFTQPFKFDSNRESHR